MIKKIILLWVILGVLYGFSIFFFPSVSSSIDTLLGIPGFSQEIRSGKSQFDSVVTDIPKVQEVLSGAMDAKETLVDGVATTKEKIDTIRSWAQKVQETVEEGKQTYQEAKEVFDDASQKVEKIQGIIEEVQTLTGSGSI